MILGEKIERNVYVNHEDFVSDIQLLMRQLLMSTTCNV